MDARKHLNLLVGAGAGASAGLFEDRNVRTELWLAKINLKLMAKNNLFQNLEGCLTALSGSILIKIEPQK